MGAWGAGIFDDDIALDIKDDYQNLLAFGILEEEVFQLAKDYYLLGNGAGDDDSIFWFVLATIQHKYGILTEEVKENTIRYIDSGEDLKNWEDGDPKSRKKREKTWLI